MEHTTDANVATSNGNIDFSDVEYDFENPFQTFNQGIGMQSTPTSKDQTLIKGTGSIEKPNVSLNPAPLRSDVGARSQHEIGESKTEENRRDQNNNNKKVIQEVTQINGKSPDLELKLLEIVENSDKRLENNFKVKEDLIIASSTFHLNEESLIRVQDKRNEEIQHETDGKLKIAAESILAEKPFIVEPNLNNQIDHNRSEAIDTNQNQTMTLLDIEKITQQFNGLSKSAPIQPSEKQNGFKKPTISSSNDDTEYSSDEPDQISTGPRKSSSPNDSW